MGIIITLCRFCDYSNVLGTRSFHHENSLCLLQVVPTKQAFFRFPFLFCSFSWGVWGRWEWLAPTPPPVTSLHTHPQSDFHFYPRWHFRSDHTERRASQQVFRLHLPLNVQPSRSRYALTSHLLLS